MRNSMELLASRDPEEGRRFLDSVLERMIEAVHRYEGTVNQVMGDGIMALFGAPVAHEDHAIRACCAALRMQEAVEQYANELPQTEGFRIQIRIGVNSGEVVVRSIGSDLQMDYTAVGQTTHLAARLEQMAPPGAIFTTRATQKLTGTYIEVKSLGHLPVKGMSEPIQVYEVVGLGNLRSRFQATTALGLTPLVGRSSELQQLLRALELATNHHAQVVAIVGDPGVGKSRLCWEFTHSQAAQNCLVLQSGTVSYGRATSFLLVTELLKTFFQILPGDDTRRTQEKVTAKMYSLDPSLEPFLSPLLWLLDIPVHDQRWEHMPSAQRRQCTLDAVWRLIARVAETQPLVLVLEDLQWIDPDSQALLDSVVARLATARILMLATYRPEYLHAWTNKTYYRHLPVDALEPAGAEELLRSLLGDHAALEPVRRLLIERTEGNPFFLEESTRTLVETGALVGEHGDYRPATALERIEIPATVKAVLAARIDRLAPEAKRLLQSASVLGKVFRLPLLRAIADEKEPLFRQVLAQLQAAEFIYETTLCLDEEYAFKHALTHEVTYGSLLRERRRELHLRIVGAIETMYPDNLTERLEQLAHHSSQGEMWDKAFGYLRRAGARAFGRSAHRSAVEWFERALDVLARLPDGPHLTEQAIDLRLDLRYALIPLGQFRRIFEYLSQAERLAGAAGDSGRLGLVYSFLANYFQITGDPERGIDYAQRALDIAVDHGDVGARVVATAYLGATYYVVGDFARAIEFSRRNVDSLSGNLLHERFGMAPLPTIYSRTSLVRSLAEIGAFADGLATAEEGVSIATAKEDPVSLSLAWFSLGYLRLRQGAFNEAIVALERAVEFSRVANIIWFQQIASSLASTYVSTGRAIEGLRVLGEAADRAAEIGREGFQLGYGIRISTCGEAHLALDRQTEAVALAREAVEFFGNMRARGHQAWALRLLGAATARGDTRVVQDAAPFYQQALTAAEALGMRPLAARCHLDLGELHRQTGRAEAARAELLAAADLFRSLGMDFWSTRVDTQLAIVK
jgi:class 3 adenylate cyclase/tetratricopeptide (TPR) repeat protein